MSMSDVFNKLQNGHQYDDCIICNKKSENIIKKLQHYTTSCSFCKDYKKSFSFFYCKTYKTEIYIDMFWIDRSKTICNVIDMSQQEFVNYILKLTIFK